MTYCARWTVMTICIGAGLCRPFAYNWNKIIEGGRCGALIPAYISISALDILGDTMTIGRLNSLEKDSGAAVARKYS